MPPVISKKPLSFTSKGTIVKTPPPSPDDLVTGLFSMEGASDAMRLVGFDQEELVTNMISLMRDGDPDIRLRGTKLYWDVMKDIVTYNGQVASQTLTQESTSNGITHRKTTTITTLAGSPTPSYTSGAFSAPRVPSKELPLHNHSPTSALQSEPGVAVLRSGPEDNGPLEGD